MATTSNANTINTPAMPAPWTAIVRGEFDTIAAANAMVTPSPLASSEHVALVASPSSSSMVDDDESSDHSNGSNGHAGGNSAWNKPSNRALEVGPVMGAASWPALSQSAKPSQDSLEKSSSTYVTQITGSVSSTPQKQLSHHAKPDLASSDTMPTRQRAFKRNSIDSTSNGSSSQPPGSQPQTGNLHLKNSPRDNSQRNSSVHPHQQHNSIRRNGGLHSHRNFYGRDAHMQSQRAVPRFKSHPPSPLPTQFIGVPPFRAYELAPVMYPVAGPPDSLTAVPYFVALIPHALYFPSPDPDIQLCSKTVNQIDYYFSNENLIKDTFLRQNMDEQGFIPVKLIAGFKKVLHLTDNIQLILDALRSSTIAEVQGDKVRRRNDWMRWIISPSTE